MKTTLFGLSLVLLGLVLFSACEKDQNNASPAQLALSLTEFNDKDYPDNPDIGFRSKRYNVDYFDTGMLKYRTPKTFDLKFNTKQGDSLILRDLDLTSWVPQAPKHLKDDEYLTELALVNQEWNRNQVAFRENQFETSDQEIVRLDLARNCLNSYLWETILYTKENGKEMPIAHAWFDFPKPAFDSLFTINNDLPFSKYSHCLVEWEDPESKAFDRTKLRKLVDSFSVNYKDLSDEMYPQKGERAKKMKEVVYPPVFTTMRDLQNDSTTYATFMPPGNYDRSTPRKTELGRFINLNFCAFKKVQSPVSEKSYEEIELVFSDENERKTKFVLGGIEFGEIPILPVSEANSAWQNSMGFGNHSFYESYAEHKALTAKENVYYAYLTDGENKWLDSHKIGIDGPLMHFSDSTRQTLHLWLLSFERHTLVGHYRIELP